MSGKQKAVAAAIGSDDDDDDEATMATPEDGRHIAGVNRQALPTARQHQIAAGSERQAQPDAKQHQRAAAPASVPVKREKRIPKVRFSVKQRGAELVAPASAPV